MVIKDLNTFGYFLIDLSKKDIKPIKDEIELVKKDKTNFIDISSKVDAHISATYFLKDSIQHIENIVFPYFNKYQEKYNYVNLIHPVMDKPRSITTNNDVWVSIQNKYEFNPAHSHPGLMSFVIWTEVPYTLEGERDYFKKKPWRQASGAFSLFYTDSVGTIKTEVINVDKTYENKLLLFPSRFAHSVNPFYSSDKSRISVAGNIYFKV